MSRRTIFYLKIAFTAVKMQPAHLRDGGRGMERGNMTVENKDTACVRQTMVGRKPTEGG